MANLNKKQREAIYAKYNGHCSYCGKEIAYKDMQVDHQIPQRRATARAGRGRLPIEKIENFDNYFPSCRRCNLHKRSVSLETYRRYVEEIPQKLLATFIYKAGLDYKLIEVKPRKIKFYFEMTEEERAAYDNKEPAIEVYPIEESDIIEGGEFF